MKVEGGEGWGGGDDTEAWYITYQDVNTTEKLSSSTKAKGEGDNQ